MVLASMVVMDTYQGRACAQREYRVAEAKRGLSGPTLQTQAKASSRVAAREKVRIQFTWFSGWLVINITR